MMRMLKYLLEKEFKQIRRDRFLPRIIFLLPVIQLVVLPFAANFEMRNINLSIVDNDHTVLSRRLTDKVLSSGYFRLADVSPRYDEALVSIESNAADIILEIPSRFEERLEREGTAELLIAANAVNGTKGGIGSSYLASIIQDFNQEKELSSVSAGEGGIMAFLLTLIGGFLSALNIVSEKEKGTIEQINVTPVPKALFLLSKLIPFWIIGLILLTIGACIAWLVYGLLPVGNMGIIYLFAAVYLMAFTGFGLAISSVSSTQQQAMFTAFFFMIIFVLLSGMFTPVSSMPVWAQELTRVNPLRYLVEVMRMVYLKGSTLSDLTGHFIAVCLFAVFFNILAIVSYKKS